MVVRPGLRGAEAAAMLRFGMGEALESGRSAGAGEGTLADGSVVTRLTTNESRPGVRAVALGGITLAVLLAAGVGFPPSVQDPSYGDRDGGSVVGPEGMAAESSAATGAGAMQQEPAQMSISRNSVRATVVAGAALIAGSAGAQSAVQWKVSEGGNGHWYRVVSTNPLTWTAADGAAQAAGGLLACTENDSETDWVLQQAIARPDAWSIAGNNGDVRIGPWLGGYQDHSASDFSEPAGGWRWESGAPVNVSSPYMWLNNATGCGIDEDRLHFWRYTFQSFYVIQDMPERGYCEPFVGPVVSYVIEWSADCNGDGMVDYGQILDGSILDANTNGVPDCCEGSSACAVLRLVPSQYATIQSAIDAAQPGDRVLVAAGTYREQVNLNGKRISLEGVAGSASTIIDGEGIRTNIVGSGEPDGCVVSGFTIQNGSGYDAGGVLLSNSVARIHHCVFRNNSASSPWGGAGFRSAAGTSLVEDCVFTNNFAQNQSTSAGWYHIFGGSFALRRCTFDGNTSNASGVAGGESGGVVAKVNPEFSEVTGLIEDCVFMAQVTGDPTPSNWGPIHVHASRGEPVLVRGCTFVAPPGGQTFAVLSGTGSRVAADRCTGCGFNDSVYAEPGSTGTVTKCDFSPTCADCNHNSVADLQEIVRGDVADTNANRIPDVCEIPGCRDVDLFRDGTVNGADLGILLAQWGVANANTVSDINHDGRVDGSDLGTLLAFWGPCLN